MLKNYFLIPFLLLLHFVPATDLALAENEPFKCIQLDAKASGDNAKYSLYGEANGQVFFSGINCAIKHRNAELCAMEMVSFDTTSKVFDFNTVEEIDIGKAHYWIDNTDNSKPILAFGSKEAAEKYAEDTKGGAVLDYTALTER